MATIYKRQSKEALVHLCEQRGIDPADKSKELLVCALMEQDAEQGSGTGQGSQDMDINPGRVSPEATHSRSPQVGMDVSLQMALQQLGECDPSLRLQLILQFNQAAAAREERAEREKERAAAEREERAAAERQADREFRLEMARIERGINSVQPQSQDVNPKRPRQERFPVLDKDGDLDIFLRSFEKTCRQYHLPREQWAQYLSPGLRGKALEVFADLPHELDEDYDAIKTALIKKYNLTPEVYRKKFRSVKRGPTDSYADTVGNLRTTFLQWTRGLSVNSREDLEDLMIKDQFLHICPVDVRQFVCDREPKTADEAAQIADSYTANRMPEAKRETSPQRSTSWKEKQARTTSQPSVSKVGENITLRESINQGDMRKCFNCNKVGHLRSACPERGATVYSTVPVVMLLSGDMDKLQPHMQTVIVGDRVTQGLRDSGASYSLVRPEIINPEDIIPEKTLPVKGITGCHPGVPVAKVFMDWGSGRGIRQVGVSQELPVDVLLGNDLGKMTTVYVPDVQQSYEKMGRSPRGLVWEGGQDSKSKAMPAPEPEVSQYEEATGEGVVNGPPEITLQSADMVKGVIFIYRSQKELFEKSTPGLQGDKGKESRTGINKQPTRGIKIADNLHYVRSCYVLDSLDQEKAFYRVSHGFMSQALRRFGLGKTFCSYVDLMYFDIHSSVLVNGWKTDTFPVLLRIRAVCRVYLAERRVPRVHRTGTRTRRRDGLLLRPELGDGARQDLQGVRIGFGGKSQEVGGHAFRRLAARFFCPLPLHHSAGLHEGSGSLVREGRRSPEDLARTLGQSQHQSHPVEPQTSLLGGEDARPA
ncbi:uncharacterized protein [Engystomops pustulosus]|uniref:uncharacterized protein n=1 Tax=Engystomops pustulosus TaxID=76066 RepID=UPI003AFA43B6